MHGKDSKRSRASWGELRPFGPPTRNGIWAAAFRQFPSRRCCTRHKGPQRRNLSVCRPDRRQPGHLYGTTPFGGGSGCSASGPGAENGSPKRIGCGIVFELMPATGGGWTKTVLQHFCTLANCSDGSRPLACLIVDSKGNLYGTTANGGGSGCSASGPGGCGTVFELSPPASGGGWTETVLHAFTDSPSDGAIPLDSQGNLYGTTSAGGANQNGTVFELTPAGVETVLYNFCFTPNCNNGVYPQAGPARRQQGQSLWDDP